MARNLHQHVCGCYILEASEYARRPKRIYLPQVSLSSHVSVTSSAVSTTLVQKYVNSSQNTLKELRYSFPLYDGVSVVAFTCETGSRIIKGRVKQRDVARATFKKAVERGETAGLLEQLPDASDIFTTTVGNIQPEAEIKITIRYIGELKHDAEVDGLRLTIPTAIAPRYGTYPGEIMNYVGTNEGMKVVIDVQMTSPIQRIISPSHLVATSIGTLSTDTNAEPVLTRASASLAQGFTELERDIVVQIVSKDIGVPRAMLETHPTIPGHRALWATLVPNFSLNQERCEIIFVADRSGSMGPNVATLKSALKVALKSLPFGTHFNICSFGSNHSFLWPQSKLYSQQSLDEAMNHVSGFAADYGGTEMFSAIRGAIEKRRKTSNTEILLLTDGEIFQQQQIISYLKDLPSKDGEIRLFTLGIGDQVSHSLIEGVARAGNGFSQAVNNGEKLDGKIMRMVKGALTSHTRDFSIEIKCEDESRGGAEIIETVSNTVTVDSAIDDTSSNTKVKSIIKLFSFANADKDSKRPESKSEDEEQKDRYSGLPEMAQPELLQAPRCIPPLYSMNRTTVYLLISPAKAHLKPVSIILKGKSQQGPLELEIPIANLDEPSETLHQLAAKKAIQELEDGYGWLSDAKDQNGKCIKESYPNLIEEIVERETVRLGVAFQVSAKACSFVAVETNDASKTDEDADQQEELEYEMVDRSVYEDTNAMVHSSGIRPRRRVASKACRKMAMPAYPASGPSISALCASPPAPFHTQSADRLREVASSGPPAFLDKDEEDEDEDMGFGMFGSANEAMGGVQSPHNYKKSSSSSFSPVPPPKRLGMSLRSAAGPIPQQAPVALFSSPPQHQQKRRLRRQQTVQDGFTPGNLEAETDDSVLSIERIVDCQTFQGSWPKAILDWKAMNLDQQKIKQALQELERGLGAKSQDQSGEILATAIVVLFLERKMPEEKETWDLIVEKAKTWLANSFDESTVTLIFKLGDSFVTV